MSWIKRNLVFVALGAVAVIALGLSGWYLYSQWTANNESTAKLQQAYADLNAATTANPNPGNAKVDNIKNAKDYRVQVEAEIAKARKYFQPIPSIPPGTNVSAADFNFAVRRTIDELRRAAATASVTLQPNYDFTFGVEKPQMRLSAGAAEPLAAQLGNIKAICEVLFAARVNNLYNLRRVRVCDEDFRGTQSDYLDSTMTTNDLAVLVPYEVTFYGFSPEVAAVLSGFANRGQGFIVTAMNVEPGTPSTAGPDMTAPGANPENPYGGNPYGAANLYGMNPNYRPNPYGAAYNPAPTQPMPMARPGSPNIVLDERQLKVTMGITVVKLLAKQ